MNTIRRIQMELTVILDQILNCNDEFRAEELQESYEDIQTEYEKALFNFQIIR